MRPPSILLLSCIYSLADTRGEGGGAKETQPVVSLEVFPTEVQEEGVLHTGVFLLRY